MTFRLKFFASLFFVTTLAFVGYHFFYNRGETLHTLYGDFTITEPVLRELLHAPCVERLKDIHQYGINSYCIKKPDFSRYVHSVGVMVLLRKYEASVCEQIAGLLHDVSHTVYSHVGDKVFDHIDGISSYQDDIHKEFLEKTTVPAILARYNLTLDDVLHKNKTFTKLEQDLPDICADRLEYNLRGGLVEGLLTEEDIKTILNDLHFKDDKWYFTTSSSARKLADVSANLTQNVWGSCPGQFVDHCMAKALKRAVAIGLLTHDDIHFSTDDVVWEKLNKSEDAAIREALQQINTWSTAFTVGDEKNYDIWCSVKARAINPWIQIESGLKRLTEIDHGYEQEYNALKEKMRPGYYLKFAS